MSIVKTLANVFGFNPFKLKQAYQEIDKSGLDVNPESIRARIYESVDKGIMQKVDRGIYQNKKGLLIQGNGRDLSFISDESIDCIITDHPWDLKKSNKGGNRNFATYKCFKYTQEDFNEKARVLKQGHFLVEFLPEENGNNYEYLYEIKQMAKEAGLKYYASVPWEKTGFVSNCGRKSKNTEMVMIFSKGKARSLRVNAKKVKATGKPAFMSGANGMLPTSFKFTKPKKMTHQAEKPVELLISIVNYLTLEDEVVLDQFAGSGSLGEACMESNRYFILIELVKKWVEKSKLRLNMEVIL